MWNVTDWQRFVFSEESGLFWGQMITVYGCGGALIQSIEKGDNCKSLQIVIDIDINRCIVGRATGSDRVAWDSPDASQSAFWAVVYCKSVVSDGRVIVHLIAIPKAGKKQLGKFSEVDNIFVNVIIAAPNDTEQPNGNAIKDGLGIFNTPNEFLRGSTLRFLCKLKEPELLEPLMPAIRVSRTSSFLCSKKCCSCNFHDFSQERALNYLSSCIDQVHTFGDILQLVIVELIYKVCHSNPSERSRFIRCIYNLLNSSSPSVRYEAAGTLVTLSSAQLLSRLQQVCYIELIVKESDNNVKLIVLDRLIALKDTPAHERVLQDLVMDILRVLAASDLEVRRKTLNLALDLVSSRNVEEMVFGFKKEVTKTHNTVEHEDTGKYRQLLVRTLHSCSIKFLSDNNEQAAADVLAFVREAMQRFEQLRTLILTKLLEVFSSIKASKIHRSALWILGEYCETVEDIHSVMTEFRQCLGDIPIVDDEMKKASGEGKEENDSDSTMTAPVQKLVTADGTYATQSAFSSVPASSKNEKKPPLRGYLLEGDYFIGAALSSTLAKLALRYITLVYDPKKQNSFIAESMLIMTSIIHLGKSGLAAKAINDDDMERIALSLKVLADRSPLMINIFTDECRKSLAAMLAAKHEEEQENIKAKEKHNIVVQTDDPITFSQLQAKGDASGTENMFELSLNQAIGALKKESAADLSSSKLSKVTQLTGFSDPVYAEAYVHVNQYDIVLDVLIVNQTSDTLQNCTLELATLGDLKLVEKPSPVILAPHDFCNIKASVKVASTENGIIFGNIVYDISGSASDRSVVVLNDIHIDIMDYIIPATCTDQEFRQMWAEFEWENKVSVNTNLTDLYDYLSHLIGFTNMRCLTPEKALSGECGFMAANLYARSIFGEYALANVSIEKNPMLPEAPVTGHIRIRAKSQGMALSLGDKINLSQKMGLKSGA
ncbi:coatomer subunit beta [Trichonephila clavipes]|nr:coatomer subunit beta [Trichonephila clavipes]